MKNIILIFSLAYLMTGCGTKQQDNYTTQPDPIPFGRTEWRSAMRNNDATPVKIIAAREAVRKEFPKENYLRDAGINQWEEQGPDGFGGRVRAIAVHPTNPNILYLGGVSGGLWRSGNGGNSWNPIGDFLPSLAVTSILIHPTNPDTMFISTGEGVNASASRKGLQSQALPGAGIMRSFDAGMTWQQIPAITSANEHEFYWINKIIFKPDDPSKIVSVGHYKNQDGEDLSALGGILHYITGFGETIKSGYVAGGTGGFIDVDWSLGKDSLLVGTQYNLVLFEYQALFDAITIKSFRGGQGGLPFPNILGRVEVAISPLDKNKVFILCQDTTTTPNPTFGRLFRSDNFGDTWTELDFDSTGTSNQVEVFKNGAGRNQGDYDNTIWISSLNDDHIIVGGIDLWRSTDGGDNFSNISEWENYGFGAGTSPHADQHIIIESSDFSSTKKKIYIGSDGGIASTNNYELVSANTGWNLINNNLSITQFYGSAISDDGDIVAGSQDNGTVHISGSSWEGLVSGDGGHCGFGPGDTIYVSFQQGWFLRIIQSIPAVETIARLSGGPGVLTCNGIPKASFSIDDNPSFIAPLQVFPANPRRLLIAGENLFVSDNTGCDWSQVSPITAIADTQITAIEINGNGKVVVGYKNGAVFRAPFGSGSSPASPSWVQIDGGLFDGPITDIAISPNNASKIAVSVGGYDDDNIFVTFNNGSTWFSRSNGIPALHVNTLEWHFETSNWLYAGTDLGVFSTEDNGVNWNVSPNYSGVSDGPVFTEITNLEWGPEIGAGVPIRYLYATTYGRGVWKTKELVKAEIHIDEDYSGVYLGTYGLPFNITEDAEAIQAHGQTWFFDAALNAGGPKTLYPIPSGGVLIDKRIGVIKKRDGNNGSIVIGEN